MSLQHQVIPNIPEMWAFSSSHAQPTMGVYPQQDRWQNDQGKRLVAIQSFNFEFHKTVCP